MSTLALFLSCSFLIYSYTHQYLTGKMNKKKSGYRIDLFGEIHFDGGKLCVCGLDKIVSDAHALLIFFLYSSAAVAHIE